MTELQEALTPKAETIPTTTTVKKSTTEPYQPFEEKRFAELIKQEMLHELLEYGYRQQISRKMANHA